MNKGLQMILAEASYFEDFKNRKYPMITEKEFQEKIIQDVKEILGEGNLEQKAQERVQQWLQEIEQL